MKEYVLIATHAVVALVVGLLVFLATQWWYARDIRVLTQANTTMAGVIESSNKRLGDLEDKSKKEGDAAAADLKQTKANLEKVTADYNELKAQEKKGPKVKVEYVTVPGKDVKVPVYLTPDNTVVCERFFDSFKDKINLIVDQVNAPVPDPDLVTSP